MIGPYTTYVSRRADAKKGPRPKQGRHLLSLRGKAGLTQTELAAAIGVPQANITFWEWSEKPPKSNLLPKMAGALGVRVQDLIYSEHVAIVKRAGPVGEVQRVFESVRDLPRSQQRKIIDTVDALVEQYQRKKAQ